MKGKIQVIISIILSAVIFSLLSLSFVSASTSTITADAATSRATLGTNIVITSQITADSNGASGSAYLTCSPSTYSVAEGSQSFSLSASQSTTKTFTFSASQSSTYSCQVTDGTVSSTPATTLTMDEPSVLTISGDSSTISKTSGQTFTLSISLTNSQSSAITSSYSLNLPSGYSASGDPTSSSGTSFAVGTTTLSWTITTGSSSGTIRFQLGSNTNAFSKSVTITTSGDNGGTTGGTTSSTGGISTSKSLTITPNDVLTKITVNLKTGVSNPSLAVVKLASVPVAAPAEKVYQYMNITKSNFNDSNIENATIEFKVNKSWIDANGFNSVSLSRYENGWKKLKTDLITSGTIANTYKAYTSGFSYFAIVGEKSAAPQTPMEQPEQEQPMEMPKLPPEQQPAEKPAPQNILPYIVILVIIGIVVLFIAKKKNLLKMPRKIEK